MPNAIPDVDQNNTGIDIGGLLYSLNYFQIDIPLPKFNNGSSKNPMEFLNEFEKFCAMKKTGDENKILVVWQCLSDIAHTWLDLNGEFTSYAEFKISFIDKFYSIPIRTKIKNA